MKTWRGLCVGESSLANSLLSFLHQSKSQTRNWWIRHSPLVRSWLLVWGWASWILHVAVVQNTHKYTRAHTDTDTHTQRLLFKQISYLIFLPCIFWEWSFKVMGAQMQSGQTVDQPAPTLVQAALHWFCVERITVDLPYTHTIGNIVGFQQNRGRTL